MTRLTWDGAGQRFFETGLDRGVLYLKSAIGMSTTSLAITTGSKTFALSPTMYEPFKIGDTVKAAGVLSSNYMIGTVIASNGTSITLNVTSIGGTGTFASWTLTKLNVAVPWNGLISVDENGADAAATFYMDGRPFLNLPKPKEFAATLRAYTYPDEFSAIQGVVEATDGMYLDSQQPDSFDLSYRTKVGNDVDGIDHAYRIHLVYNATVTPQNATYQTLSNQINPNEFSWNIQAVPVIIEGYRPTAHVIIDTRGMTAIEVTSIEDLIYGTTTSFASLPDPQAVFDLLTYGNAIIIIDNGDGTWEAQGSYKNVYMIGDGVFQIDNVNATDLGDGTYNISSTP